MNKSITLSNDFHGTSITIRPVAITEGRFAGLHRVSRATQLKARRTLCGISGCTCGDSFGSRGGAYIDVVNEDYERNLIVDLKRSNLD